MERIRISTPLPIFLQKLRATIFLSTVFEANLISRTHSNNSNIPERKTIIHCSDPGLEQAGKKNNRKIAKTSSVSPPPSFQAKGVSLNLGMGGGSRQDTGA